MSDRRLIEDYLPIEQISAEAAREKSGRGISSLHLWWARRPLVASRAAVFGALVLAQATGEKFVIELCKYPGHPETFKQAQRLVLKAHAERLTAERGELVTVEDIEAGRAPCPRVLDMFAGGGAIPLEALRLGCETYALELNPVAHLIELCTLVYPQKYGKPDPSAKGSAKDGTWAGLADEVEYWGKWVLERVRLEIGDLYPPIPVKRKDVKRNARQLRMHAMGAHSADDDAEMLTPVAYLWTRTVRCKNPTCGGTVPLVRQTWLAKKTNRYVALKIEVPNRKSQLENQKSVSFRVVESTTERGLGFDPADLSKGGNATCPFCGTVVDSAYVKAEGKGGRIGRQAMAVVCTRKGQSGRIYISADDLHRLLLPDDDAINTRIENLCVETGLTVPNEPIEANPRSFDTQYFGLNYWRDLFTPRQIATLMCLTKTVHALSKEMKLLSFRAERIEAVQSYLGLITSRSADHWTTLCTWNSNSEKLQHTFARQSLPMVWDFAESNPFGDSVGDLGSTIDNVLTGIRTAQQGAEFPAHVVRGSAMGHIFHESFFDGIITDPPYYDNVSYSNLSDFFYVWLKRVVGDIHSEHFSSGLTPKKNEVIAASYRHGGNKELARQSYQEMMGDAFAEANRILKPNAPLVIVYAHKTTLGWSTLVDALRKARFIVTEAWPLDTEMRTRAVAMDTSALASSIFLVARRREGNETGSYEKDVQSDLQAIVKERVETLWSKGVTGADLVIACVGAGLRAFTRFARLEYANGEEVPADKFLAEVEGAVLETLLEKLFGMPRSGVSGVDAATRFYVLWRFAYRNAAIDAGEAIVFAYPQGVELDGARGVSAGSRALVKKESNKYRLRDFTERGHDDKLGLPQESGSPSLIDVLHRVLWLMENKPRELSDYLMKARSNLDQLRVVAETLAGAKLAGNGKGGGRSLIAATGAEASALKTLTTNWRTVIEANVRPMM